MSRLSYIFAATLIGAAAVAQPAAAQEDFTTATFGGTTVWMGGGFSYLALPEVKFTGKGTPGSFYRQKNSDFSEYGGTAGGGFETALGWWGNMRVSAGIQGFWAGVENDDHTGCNKACVVIDPTGVSVSTSRKLRTKTDRDTDYWGGQAELKFARGEPVHVKPNVYRNDYFIVGFGARGLDQDNKLHSSKGTVFTYNETLETEYYGGYIGFGGEYSFGFIPVIGKSLKGVGGIYDRLGLRTFLNVRAGLYDAQTDYTGRFTGPRSTKLGLSDDELAFIGTVSLETRKQIGARTSLSLWTDYEYISSAPQMEYANGLGSRTRIEDDDVFATRTMLRLNVGLGSQQLYTNGGY